MKNEKGEDWPKYLKELNALAPMLSENMERKGSGLIGKNGKLEPINNKIVFTDKRGAIIQKKEDLEAAAKDKKNRQQRRAEERAYNKRMGKLNEKDDGYLQRMLRLDKSKSWLKDVHRITGVKQEKINLWFDEELRMLLGYPRMNRISKWIDKHNKWPWWHWATYVIKLKITHDTRPYPWGTDCCEIKVFGRLHVGQNFVWESK